MLTDNEVTQQVEEDRLVLSDIVGYDVVGLAYPNGGENNNDRVAQIIRETTGIKYARTIVSTYSFALQDNLLRFNPTMHHNEAFKQMDIIETFLQTEFDAPALLYIWGHSYEFDARNTWQAFDKLCQKLSGRDDIFYGTNREVFGL